MNKSIKQLSETFNRSKSKYMLNTDKADSNKEVRLIKNKAGSKMLNCSEYMNFSNSGKLSEYGGLGPFNRFQSKKINSKSLNLNSTHAGSTVPALKSITSSNNALINHTKKLPYTNNLVSNGKKEVRIELNSNINLQTHPNPISISNSAYNNSSDSFQNIKSRYQANYMKKLPKMKLNEYLNFSGSLLDEFVISDEPTKESLRVNNTNYTVCSLKDFKNDLKKECSIYNSKYEKSGKIIKQNNTTKHHYRSKSDFNLYKSIFDRPILFKNNNSKEFKLSESEFNLIEKADLLKNIEKEENKILMTKKKSWLIKGVVDQLYPQIMALRTSLIRKGLIKNK